MSRDTYATVEIRVPNLLITVRTVTRNGVLVSFHGNALGQLGTSVDDLRWIGEQFIKAADLMQWGE